MAVEGKKREANRHVEAVLASCDIMYSFLLCPSQTLKQITDQTNMLHSRVLRIAGTLEARGFLHRDPKTKIYRLGVMLLSLGRVCETQSSLVILGQPILQELAHTTGESAAIYVLDNLERVVLASAEGENDIRMAMPVGQRAPLHLGASGKVLLAFGPKEVRDKVLKSRRLSKVTSRSITNPSMLAKELDRIKTRGYGYSIEEIVLYAGAVAAPIFERENHFLGALGIAGSSNHFSAETLPEKIKLVMSAAAELTQQLGGFTSSPSKKNQGLKLNLETYDFKSG